MYEQPAGMDLSQGDILDDCPILVWRLAPPPLDLSIPPEVRIIRVVVLTHDRTAHAGVSGRRRQARWPHSHPIGPPLSPRSRGPSELRNTDRNSPSVVVQ
jgi:hypothetical protein